MAFTIGGCANIVPPGGGDKDITPPVLRSVTPADSGLNTRPRKIELQFDEYVQLSDAQTQIQISPLLPFPLTVTSINKHVTITLPDTLLLDATTYRITFGNAIRDLHEGNIYNGGSYTFSTGAYFDSLSISGTVHNALTGQHDTSALVLLYLAKDGDSAVVRKRPLYVTHTDASGNFLFKGLPERSFNIYALHDLNGNLTFDGGKEWIAFHANTITPASSDTDKIDLHTFPESHNDTAKATTGPGRLAIGSNNPFAAIASVPPGTYKVGADTSTPAKRTQDITQPLTITFGRRLLGNINQGRIFLATDSAGATVEAPVNITQDTSGLVYSLNTTWQEDALYTLRLQKGFAVDSNGNDLLPGRYTFRTKRDDDYGKLRIHLPSKYYGPSHILQVATDHDTIYQKPVTDSNIALLRIAPGVYSMRIIEDKNQNGRWDAGDLFLRRQPEVVIPYNGTVNLKAGWEQQIDFEAPVTRKLDLRPEPAPAKK
jgi:uncharacterized protein (DUF2141 family)